MKRIMIVLLSVMGLILVPASQAVPKHALARIAFVATAPVVHPVKSATLFTKATLMSVLFTVETGVDGARMVLTVTDKALDAISAKGKIPVLDNLYAFVGIAAADSGKLDGWLERQEQGLFGRHN